MKQVKNALKMLNRGLLFVKMIELERKQNVCISVLVSLLQAGHIELKRTMISLEVNHATRKRRMMNVVSFSSHLFAMVIKNPVQCHSIIKWKKEHIQYY